VNFIYYLLYYIYTVKCVINVQVAAVDIQSMEIANLSLAELSSVHCRDCYYGQVWMSLEMQWLPGYVCIIK